MEIKIIEREGVPQAIDEAVSTFFSGDRRAVEDHFVGHEEGDSSTLFRYENGELVGILTIRWNSRNPNLRRENVPLIQNIEIKSGRRGQGLGNKLMAYAEDFIRGRSARVAICVRLSAKYGPAQRLYAKRGYIPDGQGFTKVSEPTEPGGLVMIEPLQEGQEITVGGNVLLWLYKDLI